MCGIDNEDTADTFIGYKEEVKALPFEEEPESR